MPGTVLRSFPPGKHPVRGEGPRSPTLGPQSTGNRHPSSPSVEGSTVAPCATKRE
jgi:hypothetical protein